MTDKDIKEEDIGIEKTSDWIRKSKRIHYVDDDEEEEEWNEGRKEQ